MDERCGRPGCGGKMVEGICEDCGRPPAGKTLLADGGPALSGAASARSSAAPSARSSAVPSARSAVSSSSSLSGRTGSGRSGRTGSRGSRSSSRLGLGAGLVSLPALPSMDPLNSLMAEPVVPDRKRYCNNCQAKLNHERGFCPMCGQEYSFQPTLKPGDIVAGQYEVKGAMAFGGLGWIYLGWDKTLSRWVVLKGLLNSKDEASAAVAVAERQFLAAVKHPKIVGVYNFVQHGAEGYIVMEYVGGKTLKAIRQERGPLPVTEAIAYIHGILPAFAYLHRQGMVYCDFKPDNVMLEDDDVKLIDMGGVRRADDAEGDIYGTKGYSAPEAHEYPSYTSDLYTVGRTLAVLLMDFKFQGQHEFSLPKPSEQPLFEANDSLYRFLLRATHQDPDWRFQSAEEMTEQLLGVLREIVSRETGPHPAESAIFFGDQPLDGVDPAIKPSGQGLVRLLPMLRLDAQDTAAAAILNTMMMNQAAQRSALQAAMNRFKDSAEAPLRLAHLETEAENYAQAGAYLAHVREADPFDWRVSWYLGRLLLRQGNGSEALAHFDRVYSELPGELAPKLAVAAAAECRGDFALACRMYDRVSRVDPGYTTAAFGLARCRLAAQDRAGGAEALRRVPQSSSAYTKAQMALATALIGATPEAPGIAELKQASEAIQSLAIDGLALHELSAQLLLTAVELTVRKRLKATASDRVLGLLIKEADLRAGAERELRACARFAATKAERIAYIDRANRVRPLTLI